jgi:hypothetical protein
VTARLNLRRFIADWPYEVEDLRADTGPVLVGAKLPRNQDVADAHTRAGIAALDLPDTYPFERGVKLVGHMRCQTIGTQIKDRNLRGVRARSAQTRDGAGRELAWFPASARSRARQVVKLDFEAWFWR